MIKTASFFLFSIIFNLMTVTHSGTPNAVTLADAQIKMPFEKSQKTESAMQTQKAPQQHIDQEQKFAAQLHELPITLHPGTKHRSDSRETPEAKKHCESIVYQTLQKFPEYFSSLVKELTLFYASDGRRGYAGRSQIILRCLNMEDGELVSILTHEMAHLIDEDFLQGSEKSGESGFFDFGVPIYENDPSVLFYRLSWKNEKELLEDASRFDFCSGYAMTDPFEDFGECFTLYRLHGPAFRQIAENNIALRKKYEFLKQYVFNGQEFDLAGGTSFPETHRVYDATILPFDLASFLNS